MYVNSVLQILIKIQPDFENILLAIFVFGYIWGNSSVFGDANYI